MEKKQPKREYEAHNLFAPCRWCEKIKTWQIEDSPSCGLFDERTKRNIHRCYNCQHLNDDTLCA